MGIVIAEGEETANPKDHETVTPKGEDNRITAAGALPWRRRDGQLEVALVHRPRYDDWSWPKGKLDPGEEWPVAAAREAWEETGFYVRLGRPLPSAQYTVQGPSGEPATKAVRYWAAEMLDGDGTLVNEIDEVAWLDVAAATDRLSYPRDLEQLHALGRADHDLTLATWPLVLVRHAKSRARPTWKRADPLRPLNSLGRARAAALVPILAAFGVTRVVTSPSVRCLDTVLPYAVATGYGTHIKRGLSEEGFAERPGRATHHLTQLLERGEPAVLCSHGPVLPGLLEQLSAIAHSDGSTQNTAKVTLSKAARSSMGKGEVLVAHVAGTGPEARVVDIESYPAP